MTAHLSIFEAELLRLKTLAYKLLGSLNESEDLLQDVFIRWQKRDLENIERPEHYLTRMVSNLALDRLRSAQHQREVYTGPWLPEPWIETDISNPHEQLELAESLTMAFMLMLEQLKPLERAVFVLRTAFDYEYDEIAEMLGENAVYCRQILHRARQHLHKKTRSFPLDQTHQQNLLQAFISACQLGELSRLQSLLAEDVVLYSDGGGKVRAALNPIYGSDKVARFIFGILSKAPPDLNSQAAWINGQLGLQSSWDSQIRSVMSFDWQEGQITAIYIVVNPDKLSHLAS